MPSNGQSQWDRVRAGRVRILWLVLGALLLVSALPIGLYHRQVLQLSQDKLVDTERVQQTDLTRSVSQEIQLFESNLTQQLISERQILALTGLIDNVEDTANEPKVTLLLENFVNSNRSTFIYLTAVGKTGKGTSASQGNFRAEQDPFVAKALGRAFQTCQQSQIPKYRSDPLALAPENRPAFVVAVPLRDVNENFTGMLAAVVSLESILHRLQEASVRGRTVFLVDHNGRIVAHPDTTDFVPGADASSNTLVAQVKALPQDLRSTETVRFAEANKKHSVDMIGTYSTFPEVNWAVIAQRSLDQAQTRHGRHGTQPPGAGVRHRGHSGRHRCRLFFRGGHQRADSRPGSLHARHQPRRISPALARCAALRKSASSLKTSTRWLATSKSTSSA